MTSTRYVGICVKAPAVHRGPACTQSRPTCGLNLRCCHGNCVHMDRLCQCCGLNSSWCLIYKTIVHAACKPQHGQHCQIPMLLP